MARDVPRNFAATCGVTHDRSVLEIEGLDHSLKQAGGADVILVTSNSYKAASESLKGLRPDGRMVLMGISEEPLVVTSEIIGNRIPTKRSGISE
ncbi:MAG: hypothetical protein WA364_06040 [Candidatus Nitrosopolaris sp.]